MLFSYLDAEQRATSIEPTFTRPFVCVHKPTAERVNTSHCVKDTSDETTSATIASFALSLVDEDRKEAEHLVFVLQHLLSYEHRRHFAKQ